MLLRRRKMPTPAIIGCVVLFLLAAILITAYICFYKTFYSPSRNKKKKKDDLSVRRVANVLMPYRSVIGGWKAEVAKLPYKEVSIKSFDGLQLVGRYYESEKGAPVEIFFHGYRGCAERDMDGGVLRCLSHGRNALAVDHRASGKSEGHVITFGVNESRDCLSWVDFVINSIDKDAKIILTGISMGAATVMTAAGKEELPKNVVAVLADCGYTSAKEIIMATIKSMKLPPRLLYPFVKLGARLYGNFDIDETSPIESVARAKVPIIFIHGDFDDFVPHEMGERNYEACSSAKRFVPVEGAGHAAAFLVDPELYLSEIESFFEPLLRD